MKHRFETCRTTVQSADTAFQCGNTIIQFFVFRIQCRSSIGKFLSSIYQLFVESISSFDGILRSSSPSMSPVSRESRISVIPKVNVELMLKSVNICFHSKSFRNINIKIFVNTLKVQTVRKARKAQHRLQCFSVRSESTFPLSIVTFVKLSTGRIIAVTITNGEYISVFSCRLFTSSFWHCWYILLRS